jgi:hypothetical protein
MLFAARLGLEEISPMKSHKAIALTLVCIIAIVAVGAMSSASSEMGAPLRNFEFTYLARIPALPAEAKTSRIWIPLPQSDRYQTFVLERCLKSAFQVTEDR